MESPSPSPRTPRPGTATQSAAGASATVAVSRLSRIYSGIRRLTGITPDNSAISGDEWRYSAAREINRGGMGTIYRVRDLALDRELALKAALGAVARDPAHAEAFVREARITARLEHPNIVPVHDFGQTPDGAWYYTMKLVDGEPMTSILSRLQAGNLEARKKFDTYQRLTIFHKVCSAVAFAHAHGVIHRDIKPENIMVGAFGEVLLMDWGLAKRINGASEPEAGAGGAPETALGTNAGYIKGTPAYMSPEQACGRNDEVDRQTDVFLLGATLYHFMTFQPPYRAATAEAVVDKAAAADFVPPSELTPQEQIPDEVCRIILRAMAPDRAERYPGVQDLIEDLDRFLAGRTPGVRRSFRSGELLMHEGEHGNEGYLILSGSVEISRSTPEGFLRLGILGPGEIVGEMAALTAEARTADVTALEDTEVEVISAEAIKAEMRKIAPWMSKLVGSITSRLRQATEKIHPLLFSDCIMQVARQIRLILPSGMAAEQEVLVTEIARSLALPYERVASAIERLVESEILLLHGDNSISIRDQSRLLMMARWKAHPI